MAKSLMLEFATASGTKTQMTLDDDLVKQNLDESATKTAMENMIASGVFATSKGEVYITALGASYIERTETPIFSIA